MPAGRLLNRDDLDKAFPDNPVLVGHVSMHGAVMNSAALKKWNFTSQTKTPPGGVIVRKPGTKEPYGLIMETAYLPVFAAHCRSRRGTGDRMVARGPDALRPGRHHDRAGGRDPCRRPRGDAARQPLRAPTSSTSSPIHSSPISTTCSRRNPVASWGRYDKRLKIGGVKITIDGSPQGRTAYFTTPYLTGGPGGEKNWRGELTFPQEMVNQMVKRVYDLGVPLNLHANGDAAIDAFFTAHEARPAAT